MAAVQNVAVGGPVTQVQTQTPGNQIPFRRATTFRVAKLTSSTTTVAAGAVQIDVEIQGSGYIYGMDIHRYATTASNSAATAFNEDGPWNVTDTFVFRDVNGELCNVSGYHWRLMNLYGAYIRTLEAPVRGEPSHTLDTANIYNAVTGAGATGGSYRMHYWVPVGLNHRELRGILGNQDNAQKYSIRTDLAASGTIYATAPTTLPSDVVERYYYNYSVPAKSNANNAQQAQFPQDFGIMHFTTQSVNSTAPAGGGPINHYLARLGNTIRFLVFVLRSTTTNPRLTAEQNAPTSLQLNIGDTPIFVETPASRRWEMYKRYGFDAPNGVYVYDFMTDIILTAGAELGLDYMFTNGLTNAQWIANYPSGFGTTANSLTVLTDDLIIPPSVNIYA